jgi:hypothetical protein
MIPIGYHQKKLYVFFTMRHNRCPLVPIGYHNLTHIREYVHGILDLYVVSLIHQTWAKAEVQDLMDTNRHFENTKKIKKILGSGPSCWKSRGICMPPCICFGDCFNFFLVVWGRYLDGTHWVYGKKNNVEHFGKWNVCTCEHLVVQNALLAFMLCKSTVKFIRKKFQRSLYWWPVDKKCFSIVFLSSVYTNYPHVLCTHLCSQQAPYLLIYATYPLTQVVTKIIVLRRLHQLSVSTCWTHVPWENCKGLTRTTPILQTVYIIMDGWK